MIYCQDCVGTWVCSGVPQVSGAGGARGEVKRRRAKKMNWSGQGPALASGDI